MSCALEVEDMVLMEVIIMIMLSKAEVDMVKLLPPHTEKQLELADALFCTGLQEKLRLCGCLIKNDFFHSSQKSLLVNDKFRYRVTNDTYTRSSVLS